MAADRATIVRNPSVTFANSVSGCIVQTPRMTPVRLFLALLASRTSVACRKAMFRVLIIGLGITVQSGLAMADHEHETDQSDVINVIAIEYPPLLGEGLENYGIIFELLSSYANDHFKIRIKPLFLPPARAKQNMTNGHWCLSTYPADSNDIDAYFVRLLDKTIKIGLYRKRRAGNTAPFRWNSLSELGGSSIAILRTNVQSPYIESLMRAGIKPVYVETRHQAFQMLLGDRVDYAQGDNLTLDAMPDISASAVEFSDTVMFETESGFYYRKSCADRVFKAGHAPHLIENQPSDELVQ